MNNTIYIAVLLIEDDPGDAFLIEEMLAEGDNGFHLERAERLADGIEKIRGGRYDIILLDMSLPDSSGIHTLQRVIDVTTDISIIVLTGLSDEEFGVEAVKLGAQDYLVKGEINARVLRRGINYALERKKLEVALRKANERMEQLATTDTLTGILNRLKFNEMLDAEIKRALRYESPLSMIMFDLDYFKRVNDTYGHHVGDHVLRETARIISEHIRAQDFFSRWGGEEFMILAPNTDPAHAAALTEKLKGLIEGHDFGDGLRVTASFGVTGLREADSPAAFSSRVDEALYKAKRNGRNRVEIA